MPNDEYAELKQRSFEGNACISKGNIQYFNFAFFLNGSFHFYEGLCCPERKTESLRSFIPLQAIVVHPYILYQNPQIPNI